MDVAKASIYQKLPTTTSIRLLDIGNPRLPSFSDSAISTTLHIVDFEDSPRFRALSYTWGEPYRNPFVEEDTESPPVFSKNIRCNGVLVAVTRNLFDALTAFLKLGITGLTWVDAVCINQQDLEERCSQVSLMSKIYPLAFEVLVWIGPPADGIEEFVWATTEFLDSVQESSSSLEAKDIFSPGKMIDKGFWQQLGLEYPTDKLVKFAIFYKSCRWFARAWVVQEIILSYKSSQLRVFCGEKEVSFLNAFRIAGILIETGWSGEISTIIGINHQLNKFEWLRELYLVSVVLGADLQFSDYETQWKSGAGWVWSLSVLLRFFKISACLDPRDKIYAFLGIIDFRFRHSPFRNRLRADYTISREDLYTQVTTLILENSLYLDYIADPRRHSVPPANLMMPSWVIDYSSYDEAIISYPEEFFDAAYGNKISYPKFAISRSSILCYGALFDIVDEIQDCVQNHVRESATGLFGYFGFYFSLPARISGHRRFEVFWRTQIFNRDNFSGSTVAPETFEEMALLTFKEDLWIMNMLAETEVEKDEVAHTMAQFNSQDISQEERVLAQDLIRRMEVLELGGELETRELQLVAEETSRSAPYTRIAARTMSERRLFKTRSGLLGMGQSSLQKGDQVWLLTDAHVPFILRPTDQESTFTVVGDCYVHDFMHGEMLENQYGVKDKIGPITLV